MPRRELTPEELAAYRELAEAARRLREAQAHAESQWQLGLQDEDAAQ